jgi:hypothetical protein
MIFHYWGGFAASQENPKGLGGFESFLLPGIAWYQAEPVVSTGGPIQGISSTTIMLFFPATLLQNGIFGKTWTIHLATPRH